MSDRSLYDETRTSFKIEPRETMNMFYELHDQVMQDQQRGSSRYPGECKLLGLFELAVSSDLVKHDDEKATILFDDARQWVGIARKSGIDCKVEDALINGLSKQIIPLPDLQIMLDRSITI